MRTFFLPGTGRNWHKLLIILKKQIPTDASLPDVLKKFHVANACFQHLLACSVSLFTKIYENFFHLLSNESIYFNIICTN